MNARYYDGRRGQFISQDPIFWGENQNLLDPQSLNSYSYANDNPITWKDPLGLFVLKTGKIEKGDTLSKITGIINKANSTSYSVSQLAKLNGISNPNLIYAGGTIKPNNSVPDVTNALNSINKSRGFTAKGATIISSSAQTANSTPPFGSRNLSSSVGGNIDFVNKFRKGGEWDLKFTTGIFCQSRQCGGQTAESYIYDAAQISGDAPGNIHYGYVGKQAGYTLNTLLLAGDVVQALNNPGQTGDTVSDKSYIMQGFRLNY